MPVFTIPYNRTLLEQLRNGIRPNNVPVPVSPGLFNIINATAPNNVVPFLNSTIPPTDRPPISGFPIGITNLTQNATAQAYPYNPAVDGTLFKRAPMPPLHPHIPSYLALAAQDQTPTTGRLNALGDAVHAWVKRAGEGVQTGNKGAPPNDVQTHLGIFFCSLAGFFVLLGVGWYIATTVSWRQRAAAAAVDEDTHYVIREKTNRKGGRPWYTRFGFKRYDKPVAYAGRAVGFHDAHAAEEGGLRAAMGGNWNSDLGGSWKTQRTAPPAYYGDVDGGVVGEKRIRG